MLNCCSLHEEQMFVWSLHGQMCQLQQEETRVVLSHCMICHSKSGKVSAPQGPGSHSSMSLLRLCHQLGIVLCIPHIVSH